MFTRRFFACLWCCAPVIAAATDIPDPMRPLHPPASTAVIAESPTTTHYELSATKLNALYRLAIINDQVVTEGDRVDGATVLKISTGSVVIKTGTETTSLRLNSHAIKHRTPSTTAH
jgi:hypothetical protein